MRFHASVLLAAAALASAGDFPPPDQVFRQMLQSDGERVTVYWSVAPGYYLYKERMGLESATPGVKIGLPCFPKGEIHKDEYLGNQEVFRDDFIVTAPLARTGPTARELMVRVKLQGCADAGFCYPPQVWSVKVKLPEPGK